MTEIIDCTKCAFYNNGKCDNPNGMSCNCINNAVCYYKELKRLEQENFELKEKNDKIIVGYIKLSERYKQTLRGIKAIVCGNYEIIDPQGRKDILKLITKAEVE